MSKYADIALQLLAWAIIIAGGIVALVIRLRNPDMSETRLFLTFWPFFVGVIAAYGVAVLLFRRHGDG